MITQVLHCPYCQGVDIVKNGKTPQGKHRYQCREQPCDARTFILDYAYPGQAKKVKEHIRRLSEIIVRPCVVGSVMQQGLSSLTV